MNVLFVASLQAYSSVDKPLYDQNGIALGISHVSSFLKQAGHATRLLVLTRETSCDLIDRMIEEFQPRVMGFTAIFSEYAFIRDAAAYIKGRFPDIILIVGGPHVSLNPEIAIRDAFDAVCVGEGEHAMLEYVRKIEQGAAPSGIPNLWIKRGGEIERNSARAFQLDLDALPFPDREMWQDWIDDPNTRPCVLLGRGCPFNCTYCCNHSLKQIAPGEYVRFRSPQNVLAEVQDLVERFPNTHHVYFEVETIGAKPEYADELCALLNDFNRDRTPPLTFSVNLRVTPKKDYGPFFATLKGANFTWVNIGLESGSPRVRSEILQRHYGNDDIVRAVQAARSHGLEVALYVLLGLPGETRQDFQETVQCMRACQPDFYYLSIFTPYPGTALYKKCGEMGLLGKGVDMALERRRPVLDLPGFTRRQQLREYVLFAYRVHKGHWPFMAIARRTVGTWIRSNGLVHFGYRQLMRTQAGKNVMRRLHWQW